MRDERPHGGDAPSAAAYFYSLDRKGNHPARHLADLLPYNWRPTS